jgi:hypothetical protein
VELAEKRVNCHDLRETKLNELAEIYASLFGVTELINAYRYMHIKCGVLLNDLPANVFGIVQGEKLRLVADFRQLNMFSWPLLKCLLFM